MCKDVQVGPTAAWADRGGATGSVVKNKVFQRIDGLFAVR
jgi:hypothetical protein